MEETTCAVEDCERSMYAKGWCRMHYQRERRTGDPLGKRPTPAIERLWKYVERDGTRCGCWRWTGTLVNGYGQIWTSDGKKQYTHRLAYESLIGPIPDGLVLDHLCRNRACCNPEHLDPVSNRTNILRGISPSALNARKSSCARGHPYNEENLYVGADGRRKCRACRRLTQQARKTQQRA